MKLINKIAFFLLGIILLFGCRAQRHLCNAPASSVERVVTIKETVHDTVLVVKADTQSFAAQITVDKFGEVKVGEVYEVLKQKEGNIKIKATKNTATRIASIPLIKVLPNNTITVDCICDSVGIYYQYKTRDTIDKSIQTITLPAIEIEKKLTVFQNFKIWIGNIILLLGLGYGLLWFLRFKKII